MKGSVKDKSGDLELGYVRLSSPLRVKKWNILVPDECVRNIWWGGGDS